jgi:hypothetical protein
VAGQFELEASNDTAVPVTGVPGATENAALGGSGSGSGAGSGVSAGKGARSFAGSPGGAVVVPASDAETEHVLDVVPVVHELGRLFSVVSDEALLLHPVLAARSRKESRPPPPRTASQYLRPETIDVGGMAIELHAAFAGADREPWASNEPGRPLTFAYSPTRTVVARFRLSV